jgi:3-deoxy-manno-octulosonate cytidylyltransferase (CMP-KDO synthetase)
MVQWVYERAKLAQKLDHVLIATDDERVVSKVKEFTKNVIMTSPNHESGTDRVAEVVKGLEADVVVNIQGDEPLISPKAIDQLLEPFEQDENLQMATLCRKAKSSDEIFDENTARVVFDKNCNALYFSRAPIPFNRDKEKKEWLKDSIYYQHIGIYAYRKLFLQKLAKLPQTPNERIEKLEQLRVLENGFKIKVVETDYTPICVDVPQDIYKVETEMKKMGIMND